MKSSIKILLSLLLLFFTTQVLAGPFDPPPTDQSVNILGVIFGDSVGNIYLGGQANPVLSNIMEKFNFIMVVVGIVVVSYVAVLSTINTAHEGTAMGKKWSAVWIPMRSVAGMALMVPAPASGYSMIQVTVMWIIIQGIGAADTLWNIALDGLSSGVSATAGTVQDPRLDPDNTTVKDLVQKILDASICMQSLYVAASLPENVQSGSWVSQYGQYVKNFSIQDAGTPTITSGSIAKGDRVAKASGYSYFGVNDANNPGVMSICGRLKVVGSVTETDDFKKSSDPSSTIPDSDMLAMAQLIYDTKIKAISSMLYVLNPLADGLASGQYSTEEFSAISGQDPINPTPPPPGYKVAAANAYILAMQSLVVPLSATYGPGAQAALPTDPASVVGAFVGNQYTSIVDNSTQTQAIITSGKNAGWVTAGSFYFVFNKTFTSTLFESAIPTRDAITDSDPKESPTNRIPSCGDTDNCLNTMLNNYGSASNFSQFVAMSNKEILSANVLDLVAKNIANGTFFLKSDDTGLATSLNFPTPGANAGPAAEVIGIFNSSGAKIVTLMGDLMDSLGKGGAGDPLLAHALLGRYIMLIIEGAFLAMIAAIFVLGIGGILIPFIGPLFAGITLVLIGLLAILWPLLGILWTLGAMLAIYCPLIPYMIFTMGVVGWLLTVVESIVAAPIIALGLVMPAGDEMGKLGSALTILANIFLRPMLMIFGFILASNLFKAVVQLIDFGMADVFKTIAIGTVFSVIVVLFVYVSFIVSITNICFSLIYAIPDKILRWIGGTGEQTNVGNLQEVKQMAQSASTQTGGGIGEAGGKVGGKVIEGAKALGSMAMKKPPTK